MSNEEWAIVEEAIQIAGPHLATETPVAAPPQTPLDPDQDSTSSGFDTLIANVPLTQVLAEVNVSGTCLSSCPALTYF